MGLPGFSSFVYPVEEEMPGDIDLEGCVGSLIQVVLIAGQVHEAVVIGKYAAG